MEIAVKAEIKNGLLWRAVKKCGNQKALAEYLGVSPTNITKWLAFQDTPGFRKERINANHQASYDRWDERLVALIGYGLEEIFPLELDQHKDVLRKMRKMEAITEMPVEQLALMGAVPHQWSLPDANLKKEDLRNTINSVLSTLTPREEQVIKMRFGLGEDNCEHSTEEVASKYALTRARIHQIEDKALRKLRDPRRARVLKEAAGI